MATQLGYAAGILLLVPAGDSGDRRRLILRLGTASTVALAACAVAPTVWWLIAASFALGLLSPVPQLVTPLAVALAAADETDGAVRMGAPTAAVDHRQSPVQTVQRCHPLAAAAFQLPEIGGDRR